MERYKLELYIVGNSAVSKEATAIIDEICRAELKGDCDVEIIDVEKDPERAEKERILAIPTLIRRKPMPERRLIGALSVRTRVLTGLDLTSAS
jgi:circadian clock protein KaiB